MVRAGLAKLLKLEKEFSTLDPGKHPKMLVVCEDTSVTPLVSDFLVSQGLNEDEILRVDSNRNLGATLPHRMRLRTCDPRHGWEQGSARRQMQQRAARKFHGEPLADQLGISAECLAGHSYIDMTRFFRRSNGKMHVTSALWRRLF